MKYLFQFQYGSIRSLDECFQLARGEMSFNSSMVRLEEKRSHQ